MKNLAPQAPITARSDPSGQALLYKLPLFAVEDPDGLPLAYLTSLKYGADHYLTQAEAKAFQRG